MRLQFSQPQTLGYQFEELSKRTFLLLENVDLLSAQPELVEQTLAPDGLDLNQFFVMTSDSQNRGIRVIPKNGVFHQPLSGRGNSDRITGVKRVCHAFSYKDNTNTENIISARVTSPLDPSVRIPTTIEWFVGDTFAYVQDREARRAAAAQAAPSYGAPRTQGNPYAVVSDPFMQTSTPVSNVYGPAPTPQVNDPFAAPAHQVAVTTNLFSAPPAPTVVKELTAREKEDLLTKVIELPVFIKGYTDLQDLLDGMRPDDYKRLKAAYRQRRGIKFSVEPDEPEAVPVVDTPHEDTPPVDEGDAPPVTDVSELVG